MKFKHLFCLLTAVLMVLVTPLQYASAQETGAGAAEGEESFEALVAAGLRAYEEENYNAAIDKFMAALVIEYQADLVYNIARCHHKNRNCHQAKRYYQKYINHPDAVAEVVEKAEGHIASLGECPATSPVAMVCTPSEALITISSTRDANNKPFQKEPCSEGIFELEPDTYNVIVEAENYQSEIRQVTITRGENEPQTFSLDAASTANIVTPPPPTGPNWIGWSLVGGGGALIIGAVVVDVVNQGVASDLEETPVDDADREGLESDFNTNKIMIGVLGGLGIAAAVTGTVFLITGIGESAPEAEPEGTAWSLTPNVSANGDMGAVFNLTF